MPQLPSSLTRQQLRVLSEVMTTATAMVSNRNIYLPDVMKGLAGRGVDVSEAAVIEVVAFTASKYDKLPASDRWCKRIFWDPEDGTICLI